MRINKLDGLRGFCSIMVLLFHYPYEYMPDFLYNSFFIRQSWSFVDFFFVLSGFVISYNYSNIYSKKSFFSFIVKRIIRLYPLLVYTTLVFFFFKVISDIFFTELVNYPKSITTYTLDTLNTLLLMNSTPFFGDLSVNLGMNFPSWSVSAEIIAYSLFGLTYLFFSSKKIISHFYLILISILIYLFKENTFLADYSWLFLRAVVGFNFGCIVNWLFKKNITVNSFCELFLPLLVLAFLFLFNVYDSKQFFLLDLIVRPAFFGFVIFIILSTNNIFSKALESKPMIFLGKLSYSIYLNHVLLLLVIPRLIFVFFQMPQTSFSQIIVLIFTVIAVVVYSVITFRLVEVNVAKFLRSRLKL